MQHSASTAGHGEEEGLGEIRPQSHRLNGLVFDGAFRDALEFFKPPKSGNGRPLEQVIDHYQALFGFLQFADEKQGLFAPPGPNGEGCDQGKCGFSPIPEVEIPGLLAYLRKL